MSERLTETKLRGLVCAKCNSSAELLEDAHCVWCKRCGPSYPVRTMTMRDIRDIARRAALSREEGR